MRGYGIPVKIINIVKAFYVNSQCAVIGNGGISEWFEVRSGVRQGCVMSGLLFIIGIDWIMKKTCEGERSGIRWTLTSQLHDLDYADDIVLLSHSKQHMQAKIDKLKRNSEALGLKINSGKTKTMRLNAKSQDPITLGHEPVEEVNEFTYLGAVVSKTGGGSEDIKSRIKKARCAFNRLWKIWRSGQLSHATKTRIFKPNVMAVLYYGCETWKMTKGDEHSLDVFQHKCLRNIYRIWWPIRIENSMLRERARITLASEEVRRRRWKWIGHVLRMDQLSNPAIALTWTPEGKRKQGRPKTTWRRTVLQERDKLGFGSWNAARATAQNRDAWRELTLSPILHLERRT